MINIRLLLLPRVCEEQIFQSQEAGLDMSIGTCFGCEKSGASRQRLVHISMSTEGGFWHKATVCKKGGTSVVSALN